MIYSCCAHMTTVGVKGLTGCEVTRGLNPGTLSAELPNRSCNFHPPGGGGIAPCFLIMTMMCVS